MKQLIDYQQLGSLKNGDLIVWENGRWRTIDKALFLNAINCQINATNRRIDDLIRENEEYKKLVEEQRKEIIKLIEVQKQAINKKFEEQHKQLQVLLGD